MEEEKYKQLKSILKTKQVKAGLEEALGFHRIVFILFAIAVIISEGVMINRLDNLELQYQMIQKSQKEEMEHNRKVNEEVLGMLHKIRNEQASQTEALKLAYKKKKEIKLQEMDTAQLKYEGINESTDLATNINISVETMDKIIDYYEANIRHTGFVNKGYAFVEAAKQSGLNPIYLFAHASCESDYGCSTIAEYHNNYFGIGAFDSNPGAAYYMGNNVDEGIISGAIWIRKNYYDCGLNTLEKMNPVYCTDSNWANTIIQIANTAISII